MQADVYLAQLMALLPPGVALSRDAAGPLARVLGVTAAELARIDGRAVQLLIEADPSLTTELLEDWERALGLPDPCMPLTATIARRRAALIARLTGQASPTPAYFVATAALFGDTVTITEHKQHNCEFDCEQPVNDEAWAFAWTVSGGTNVIDELTCEDTCELPLSQWQTGPYECAIRRAAPAHTVPIFAYA